MGGGVGCSARVVHAAAGLDGARGAVAAGGSAGAAVAGGGVNAAAGRVERSGEALYRALCRTIDPSIVAAAYEDGVIEVRPAQVGAPSPAPTLFVRAQMLRAVYTSECVDVCARPACGRRK